MADELDQHLLELFLDSESEGEFEGFRPEDLREIDGDMDTRVLDANSDSESDDENVGEPRPVPSGYDHTWFIFLICLFL